MSNRCRQSYFSNIGSLGERAMLWEHELQASVSTAFSSSPKLSRVNANPGLKVKRSINFSCLKMFFTAYVLSSLRLLKLKTEG